MVETIIGIEGMACEMCEAHINDAIRKNFRVKSAKSDRRKCRCVVVSEEVLDEELLRSTIEATGYTLTAIKSAPYQKKGFLGLF